MDDRMKMHGMNNIQHVITCTFRRVFCNLLHCTSVLCTRCWQYMCYNSDIMFNWECLMCVIVKYVTFFAAYRLTDMCMCKQL
jgi:hypothetical protein